MSHIQGERKDTAFDGRIQLNGDGAPELEVVVELDDVYLVLDHISGELGRWTKSAVHVAPIGRGWFTLDVEDEQVTFLPRRPGHFAAATLDMVPAPEEPKKRFRRKTRDKQTKEVSAPILSRKEQRRLRREEAAEAKRAAAAIATDEVAAPTDSAPTIVEPVVQTDEPAATTVDRSATPTIPPPAPAETVPVWVDPGSVPEPEIQPPTRPIPPEPEPAPEPMSPWDDVPVPEVPGHKPRRKRKERQADDAPPLPLRRKPPKPPREKTPKPRRQKPVAPAPPKSEPVGPPQKSALSRASAGFRHGLKGIAFRVSDELRQTGIVPFDRLPAAPGRKRPDENHEHAFEEHRLPGGLTRNVCHSCGLVSIGELSDDD